jgi:hypothetical protein
VPPSHALFSLGDGLVFVADPDNVHCQCESAPGSYENSAVARTARRIDRDVRTDKQAVVVAAGLVSSQHLRRFEHGAWMLTGADAGSLGRVTLDGSDDDDDVPKGKVPRTEFRNQHACFTDPRLFDVDFIVGPDAEVIRANRAVLAVNNAVLMRVLFGLQDGADAKVNKVVWAEFAPEAVRIVLEAIAAKTSVALRKDDAIATEALKFADFLGVEPCMVFTVSDPDHREHDNPKSSYESDPKMSYTENWKMEAAMKKVASLTTLGRRTISIEPDCTWWNALKRNRLLSLISPY